MSGDDIVYSSVSKGSVVLSCHTDKTGNFLNVVQRILEKLPPADNTVTYKYGSYYFDIEVQNEIVFLCMSDAALGDTTITQRFIKDIKKRFQTQYGMGAEGYKPEDAKNFQNVLRETMSYYSKSSARSSKTAAVQADLNATKDTMVQNIEKVLERGEKIELLVDKTDSLSKQSNNFRGGAKSLKRAVRCQAYKTRALMVFGILVLLWLVSSFFCGFTYARCRSSK